MWNQQEFSDLAPIDETKGKKFHIPGLDQDLALDDEDTASSRGRGRHRRRGVKAGGDDDDDEEEEDVISTRTIRVEGIDDDHEEDKQKKRKRIIRRGVELTEEEIEERKKRREAMNEIKKKYRDRAAERREGINPDYNQALSELVDMDVESSKYLGGDMEHTHLVKGLDYALLNKTRLDINKQKKGLQQHQQQAELRRKVKDVDAEYADGEKVKEKDDEEVKEPSKLANAILQHLDYYYTDKLPKVDNPSPSFELLAFQYKTNTISIPTVLNRSMIEMDEHALMIPSGVSPELAEKLSAAFERIRAASKKPKKQGIDKQATKRFNIEDVYKASASIVDDIFDVDTAALTATSDVSLRNLAKAESYFTGSSGGQKDNAEEETEENRTEAINRVIRSQILAAKKERNRQSEKHASRAVRGIELGKAEGYDDIYPETIGEDSDGETSSRKKKGKKARSVDNPPKANTSD